jgi:hypothetical protein
VWPAAAVLLVIVQAATYAVTGSSLWQSSSSFLPTTPGVKALQKTVGSDLVGFGTSGCSLGIPKLGLAQETNLMYSVHEGGIYDPIIPTSYFAAWQTATGRSGGIPAFASFCPAVASAAVARRFGISYILTAHGTAGPAGGIFVRTMGSGSVAEDLYGIPGAAPATLTPAPPTGALPPPNAIGIPVNVTHPDPSTWRLVTSTATSSVVRLHLTDVPGWQATIDGKPLALQSFSDVMLQARVPAGHHTIVVTYWPKYFTIGIVLAVLAVLALVIALVLARVRPRPGPVQ